MHVTQRGLVDHNINTCRRVGYCIDRCIANARDPGTMERAKRCACCHNNRKKHQIHTHILISEFSPS